MENKTQQTPARPFENPRYSRQARAVITKWIMGTIPVPGMTEDILVRGKDHDQIHFLYETVKNILELRQAFTLAVIDEDDGLSKADRIKAEAEARSSLATFADEMREAHRADWQARQDRRRTAAPAAKRRTA